MKSITQAITGRAEVLQETSLQWLAPEAHRRPSTAFGGILGGQLAGVHLWPRFDPSGDESRSPNSDASFQTQAYVCTLFVQCAVCSGDASPLLFSRTARNWVPSMGSIGIVREHGRSGPASTRTGVSVRRSGWNEVQSAWRDETPWWPPRECPLSPDLQEVPPNPELAESSGSRGEGSGACSRRHVWRPLR